MKKNHSLILRLILSAMITAFAVSLFAGPAAKIAQRMAPRDATGDLETVMDGDNPNPETSAEVTPTPKPEGLLSGVELLTLPRQETIQKESQEPEVPINLLDDPEVKKLLKPNPDFIYDPQNLRDPMIVPWVRNSLLVREFMENLENLVNQGNRRSAERARTVMEQIREILPDLADVELRNSVESRLTEIDTVLDRIERGPVGPDEQPTATPIPTPIITIPAKIKSGLQGILWHPRSEERYIILNDEILKEGETVPNYPEAVIEKINPDSVVVSYRGLTEELRVETLE